MDEKQLQRLIEDKMKGVVFAMKRMERMAEETRREVENIAGLVAFANEQRASK